jgi:DNA-binding response OmpR family regulator
MASAKKKILIVDDDETVRGQIALALKLKYDVIQADDGSKGYDAFVSGVVDLVITDYNMPNANGIEMVRRMRGSSANNVPVYMFTTDNSEELKQQAKELGILGHLVKPVNLSKLLVLVNKTLNN